MNVLKKHQYINDNNETKNEQIYAINTFIIISFEFEINILTNEKQKKMHFARDFISQKRNNLIIFIEK